MKKILTKITYSLFYLLNVEGGKFNNNSNFFKKRFFNKYKYNRFNINNITTIENKNVDANNGLLKINQELRKKIFQLNMENQQLKEKLSKNKELDINHIIDILIKPEEKQIENLNEILLESLDNKTLKINKKKKIKKEKINKSYKRNKIHIEGNSLNNFIINDSSENGSSEYLPKESQTEIKKKRGRPPKNNVNYNKKNKYISLIKQVINNIENEDNIFNIKNQEEINNVYLTFFQLVKSNKQNNENIDKNSLLNEHNTHKKHLKLLKIKLDKKDYNNLNQEAFKKSGDLLSLNDLEEIFLEKPDFESEFNEKKY